MPHVVPTTPQAVLDELHTLRDEFIANRALFVKSERMIPLLTALGATPADFATIAATSETLQHDPTLPFRRSKNARFCFDLAQRTLERLEFQPFILSASEDFVRHDSGKVRRFEQVGDDLQQNTVLQALFSFKAFMFAGVRHKHRPMLAYDQGIDAATGKPRDKYVCTLFHLRTVTQPGLIGEPALEGVHQDGVDFTMTTFLGARNMAVAPPRASAVTFLHSNDEASGIRYEDMNRKHLLGSVQHVDFLDTLVIVDHERKHSLSPVWQVDESEPALRDMLIFFTRKPVVEGHPSHPYDSFRPHEELRMKMELQALGE